MPGEWGHLKSSLNRLPEEVIEYIFSFLDGESQIKGQLVCRQWKRIFDGEEFSTQRKVVQAAGLKSLHIREAIDDIHHEIKGSSWVSSTQKLEFDLLLSDNGKICEMMGAYDNLDIRSHHVYIARYDVRFCNRFHVRKNEKYAVACLAVYTLGASDRTGFFPSRIIAKFERLENINNEKQKKVLFMFRNQLREEIAKGNIITYGRPFNMWVVYSKSN